MKFTVGLSQVNDDFVDEIIKNKSYIDEVYFSWGDFPNGRSSTAKDVFSWEKQKKQVEDLKKLSENKILLNLLFNANCYGKDSQSRAFFEKIGETTDYIKENFGLNSVTTTSPLIAKFIKNNFADIEVKASVNMEIGTVEGMEYISKYFDAFYMKREFNRDFDVIKKLRSWCDNNGKSLCILANSGCLNNCSCHIFHDNLVAHEAEIAKMDNAYEFCGICREYLSNKEHHKALIENTNFIRPEDIYKYEPYFKSVKLATRVNKNPKAVLDGYINSKYSGNILKILEPAHDIYPYVLENSDTLKLVKVNEDIAMY